MTKKARIAVLTLILIQLAAVGVLRQMNQVLFIKVQDTGLQQRLAQQALNRAHIDFLNAKRSLPKLAKQQGFVERGYRNDI
jgi:hypothetical protein